MPVKLGNVSDLPKGDMIMVMDGDRQILLVHTDSGIYALQAKCIHEGCNLFHGALEGENLLCRCHNSVFNVTTGAVVSGPAMSPQPVYAVTVRNGEIFLEP